VELPVENNARDALNWLIFYDGTYDCHRAWVVSQQRTFEEVRKPTGIIIRCVEELLQCPVYQCILSLDLIHGHCIVEKKSSNRAAAI